MRHIVWLAGMAGLLSIGCKQAPPPETGLGAGALAPDSPRPASPILVAPVLIDSGPWGNPDSIDAAIPSTLTTKEDSAAADSANRGQTRRP